MLLMIWGGTPLRLFKRYQIPLLGLRVPHDQLRGCKQNSHNNFRVFSNKIHPNAYIKGSRVHDDAGVLQSRTFQKDLNLFLPFAVSIIPIANLNSATNFPSRITDTL